MALLLLLFLQSKPCDMTAAWAKCQCILKMWTLAVRSHVTISHSCYKSSLFILISLVMQAAMFSAKYYTRGLSFAKRVTVRVCVCVFVFRQSCQWSQVEAGLVGGGQSQAHGQGQPDPIIGPSGQRTYNREALKLLVSTWQTKRSNLKATNIPFFSRAHVPAW